MPTVYLFNVTPLKQELFPSALSRLPQKRQEKVLSYVFDRDRRLSLGAGLLLEYWRKQQQIPLDAFTLSDSGKPELSAHIPHFFNLSHGGDFVLFGTASHPIGVDIEKIVPDFLDIAENYFTKKERQQIFASNKLEEQEKTFFRLWTLKESYMKATGQGFALPLQSFSVELNQKYPLLAPSHPLYPGFSLAECTAPPGYQASICIYGHQSDTIPEKPTEITLEQLFQTENQ